MTVVTYLMKNSSHITTLHLRHKISDPECEITCLILIYQMSRKGSTPRSYISIGNV